MCLRASPEGRVAIGSSIFPNGVVYDGDSISNYELGPSFKRNLRLLFKKMDKAGIQLKNDEKSGIIEPENNPNKRNYFA